MSDWLEFQIPSWAEYNPRADRSGYSWFRMENTFYPTMRLKKGLGAEATMLMAILLGECSSAKGATFKVRFKYLCELLGRSATATRQALTELAAHGDVIFKPLDAALTLTDSTDRQTDTQGKKPGVCPLVEIWNQESGSLAKVRGTSKARSKKAQALLAENSDLDYWRGVVRRMAANPFCRGESESGWRATFDFFLRPDTHLKVMEGAYDRRGAAPREIKQLPESA